MKVHVLPVIAALSFLIACEKTPTSVPRLAPAGSPSFSAGGNSGPSATGAGHFLIGGELRTFSFTAVSHNDGTISGEAQLNNRALDSRLHIVVDCLNERPAFPGEATVSGIIDISNTPAEIGQHAVFSVKDNGEGGNAPPDLISLVFIDASNINCHNFFPVPNAAIEGNVQVRP